MLDEFLKFGAGFDWITPLWAFIQDARYGQPFQINVPYDTPWSGRQITAKLKEKGIRTWGLMVVGETITFTVRKPQARYTLYWLERWGVLYQASVDRLTDHTTTEAFDESLDDTSDENTMDYPETIYAASAERDAELEDSRTHAEGLVEYSIRKINITVARLSGES